jgi:hypothetical protein
VQSEDESARGLRVGIVHSTCRVDLSHVSNLGCYILYLEQDLTVSRAHRGQMCGHGMVRMTREPCVDTVWHMHQHWTYEHDWESRTWVGVLLE